MEGIGTIVLPVLMYRSALHYTFIFFSAIFTKWNNFCFPGQKSSKIGFSQKKQILPSKAPLGGETAIKWQIYSPCQCTIHLNTVDAEANTDGWMACDFTSF